MSTRLTWGFLVSVLLIFGLIINWHKPYFNLKAETNSQLIVHEWGTFTSLIDENGAMLRWQPLSGPTDLPGFVYKNYLNQKGNLDGTVRMETPVIYFYTNRKTRVSVNIDFPKGFITEWYPEATNNGKSILWRDFSVMPSERPDFPIEKGESHYYPARETDSSPLKVKSKNTSQFEKFLFYRGVGTFDRRGPFLRKAFAPA